MCFEVKDDITLNCFAGELHEITLSSSPFSSPPLPLLLLHLLSFCPDPHHSRLFCVTE